MTTPYLTTTREAAANRRFANQPALEELLVKYARQTRNATVILAWWFVGVPIIGAILTGVLYYVLIVSQNHS
jgi:glycerol uptake facilitator-like aquaporin